MSRPSRIEPESIERVGHIVVKGDRGLIGLTRMAMGEATCDARGQTPRGLQPVLVGHAQQQCVAQQGQFVAPRERKPLEMRLEPERGVQVSLNVDGAAEIGFRQQQRIRAQDQATQQTRVTDDQGVFRVRFELVQEHIAQTQRRRALDAGQQPAQDP